MTRVLIHLLLSIFIFAHLLSFVLIIHAKFISGKISYTATDILIPVYLLVSYPLLGIPVLVVCLLQDISVKKEGLLVW